jgi:hypothetical protein
MFGQYEFVEGVDFSLSDVREREVRHGGQNRKDYLLHPDAFELCLMRAKNTRRYARFYGLLRKTIAGYDKYQLALEQKYHIVFVARHAEIVARHAEVTACHAGLVKAKDDKIDRLEAMLAKFEERAEERAVRAELRMGSVQTELGGVKTELGGVKTELRGVKTELGCANEKLDDANGKLDVVVGLNTESPGKLDDVAANLSDASRGRASVPDDAAKTENLVLFKEKSKEVFGYRFACVNNRSFRSELAKLDKIRPRPIEEHVLLVLRAVPNALTLYQCLNERLAGRIERQVERSGKGGSDKHFRLEAGFTEAELLDEIRAEHEARKGDYQELALTAQAWGIITRTTVSTVVTTAVEVRPYRLDDAELMDLLAGSGF